ncbi:FAD-binding protein [Microlunatus elymi]|uniref:FAD-binding protein n=1 Tax=Microlunatus elymi TaxID=2596828 RepID=A0A516Q2R5_9ACTN|nr:FAD-linked oxidase C-terminal domain-containing protein [Microlunatus elymi]QDP97698.1 FAD-binding protein [Microlunatus elymi]
MSSAALDDLINAVGPDVVTCDAVVMDRYRYDWAHDERAGMPLAVVRAETAEHVQAAVRWAAEHRVPVVPRGAGSGLSGGSTAVDHGLVISTERMRAISIDPAARVAIVEPGALNAEVKAAAAEHGLWYPPDPSSYEICSIGGNLATNAGGLCCVKYGVTTDYVLGLDVVMADGTLIKLGGIRVKDVAGLSLTKLFVGSEGTLGVITRGILKLVPKQPDKATLVATFADVEAAARAVVGMCAQIRPSMLELMDGLSINIVEDYLHMDLDRTAGAMLIAQSDAPGGARALEISIMEKVCAELGAKECFVTEDPDEGELFVAARRAAFPAIERRGSLLLEDVGVAVPLLPELIDGVAKIAQQNGIEIPVVAHAGDGNTHPNIIYDASDPDSRARAHGAFDQVMQLAISLGGTITGEHGVGRLKKDALPDLLGPDVMALSHKIKNALDPDGIMNPGAVL